MNSNNLKKRNIMKTNEELFRLLIEEGFSKGGTTVFDKYTSSDFIEHQYGFVPSNVESVKKPS